MLFLLSPAKSLDYVTPVDSDLLAQATKPPFLARSAELLGGRLRSANALRDPRGCPRKRRRRASED